LPYVKGLDVKGLGEAVAEAARPRPAYLLSLCRIRRDEAAAASDHTARE
jgi:hypothetical protein